MVVQNWRSVVSPSWMPALSDSSMHKISFSEDFFLSCVQTVPWLIKLVESTDADATLATLGIIYLTTLFLRDHI